MIQDPLVFWFDFWSASLVLAGLSFFFLLRRQGQPNMLSPSCFLVLTFILQFGFMNRPAVLQGDHLFEDLVGNEWLLIRTMALAFFSLLAFGATLLLNYSRSSKRLTDRQLPEEAYPVALRLSPLFLLYGLGLGCRLIMLRMGWYSYLANPSGPNDSLAILQLLARLERLCPYTLMALSIGWCLWPQRKLYRSLLLLVLTAELIINFAGGTKGLTLINLIYIGYITWALRKRAPSPFLAIGFLLAWLIVTPWNLSYRYYVNSGLYNTADMGSISEMLQRSFVSAFTSKVESDPLNRFLENVQARFPLLQEATMLINYADREGFTYGRKYWLLIPSAVTPRFLWPDKPVYKTGSWVTREVFGQELEEGETSTSISSLGDFYLDFGWFGPIVGFALWGLFFGWFEARFQRTVFGIFLTSAFYLALVNVPGEESFWLISSLIKELMVLIPFVILTGLAPLEIFLKKKPLRNPAK